MGEESPIPTPSWAPESPKALGGALTWQEAAVSSELFQAGKAPGRGRPTRISVASWAQWGAPGPQQDLRGSVPSPEQAPWHDVVV